MFKAIAFGAFVFNMAGAFIGGPELFRHPEWALLFGAEGAIIFGIGYFLTKAEA